MKIFQVLFALVNFVFLFSTKEIIKGKVTTVLDGNTIELVTEENELYKIQLAGIDSPEPKQPYGPEATHLLERNVKGKEVEAIVEGKNRWGIRQAIVIPPGGNDPRFILLAEGLAWTTEKNPNTEFEKLRLDALTHCRGLWKDNDPTPPWIFRRQQTMAEPKAR